ncbi:zinc finger C4H2 domain-containing protein-like [Paramacrobiotus metropolitanus]|uniref:zinc finger C4H2 domain-containing protein-like n=1 Tax=Paramacrobiotus metropolitanus TaxID=2943436 RepID=UPI0024458AD4|nr:zinc finger C4H2 domain-containing protein-like [Paramacrobiotus metropolitanus]XP_055327817.1 zinc finger C4H2 domain-containing protein-like [Paramacrobiotus metropolitanus]XP_055327818.1 zinc finger C4H2 domain-containing protein-like [Paramacrobiotus metropolitanus]
MATEEDWLLKLDTLKELKLQHEKLSALMENVKNVHKLQQTESKCLNDFDAEIKLLRQELDRHVEIIKLINKDIEDMDRIHKQSKEYREKLNRNLHELLEEYVPLNENVNKLRSALDLERLPELAEEGIQIPASVIAAAARHEQFSRFPGGFAVSSSGDLGAFHPVLPYNQTHPPMQPLPPSSLNSAALGICDSGFRQKQPPMKKCPTCGNDIHRNAPICPICKSKSHSKNPKKSKKKPPPPN